MDASQLSERSRRILVTLVREYVRSGEPVASQALASRGGLGLSSATVRHILARLEEQGFVRQPHTSAGRVPTDLGYRCYVDLLLEHRRVPGRGAALEAELRGGVREVPLIDGLLSHVSHALSRLSHHIGFALVPAPDEVAFQQIDFVRLPGSRVLVVVVMDNRQISHKVVEIGEAPREQDLRQAANYLNTEFAGLPLSAVRAAVEERLRQERRLYDTLFAQALTLARSTFEDFAPRTTLFIEGTSSLLEDAAAPGGMSIPTLRALLDMIEEKDRLVRLLTEYIEGQGLTVVIGTEHSAPDLREFSLVASTYVDGGRTGTLGVIGPTRMRYSRTISVVDGAAHAVSRVLRDAAWGAAP